MHNQNPDPAHWKSIAGIFALLLLSIFATELAVMELFSPVFTRLGSLLGGFLDAGSVVLMCAIPLWFFLFRMQPADGDSTGLDRPWRQLAKALATIFLAEFLVMQLLPYLCPGEDSLTGDLEDALLTTVVCAFPLWRLLFRPQMRQRLVLNLGTPLRLYVLLLGAIFVSDLLQELLIPFRTSFGDHL